MGWFDDLFKSQEELETPRRQELLRILTSTEAHQGFFSVPSLGLLPQLRNVFKKYPSHVVPTHLSQDLERVSQRLNPILLNILSVGFPHYINPQDPDIIRQLNPPAFEGWLRKRNLQDLEAINHQVEHLFDGLFLKALPRGQTETFPDFLTRFQKYLDQAVRTPQLDKETLHLGNTDLDNIPNLYLSSKDRFEHTYIIGKTGSGKTTLLKNLIAQDLKKNVGVIVISPEDGLFEALLPFIDTARRDDLIYFDPTDTTDPIIAFNPFHLEEGEDLTQKAGETYTIFERSLGDLGVKMTTLFQNCVYALLQRPNSTIPDLDRLLDPRDPTLREEITRNPSIDERTKKFWNAYQSSGYYKAAYEPTVNRLDSLIRPPLSQTLTASTFSFQKVLNEKPSILFCNLSHLRGIQAEIVGQLLLAQIQQTFIRRDFMLETNLIPYFFYIDEFQTYATSSEKSFQEILNRFRKYKVALTMAHQVTADIPSKLLSVIIGNVGTAIALKLAGEDAPFFAKELQIKDRDNHFRPDLLQNLHTGQGYARTPKENEGILITIPLNLFQPQETNNIQTLKQTSKKNFGKKREPAPPKVTGQASQPQPQELKKPEDFLE
jgi:hypothetical protein